NRCERGMITHKVAPSFQPLSCSASCMSRWRRLSSRYISHQPTTAASDTAIISRVARALILGLTPSRTEEKILIGRVVDSGPETKLAMTTSSSDRVKASSQPDTRAGAMIGRVIRKNTLSRDRKSTRLNSRHVKISYDVFCLK